MNKYQVADLETGKSCEIEAATAIEAAVAGCVKLNGKGWEVRYPNPTLQDVPNLSAALHHDGRVLAPQQFFAFQE